MTQRTSHHLLLPPHGALLARCRPPLQNFGRVLGTELSALLRGFVEVKLIAVEEASLQECRDRAGHPTHATYFRAEACDDPWLLEIQLDILFPIIERLLGGGQSSSPAPHRPLTEIEHRLAARVAAIILDKLQQSELADQPLRFHALRASSSAPLARPRRTIRR